MIFHLLIVVKNLDEIESFGVNTHAVLNFYCEMRLNYCVF